MVRTLAPWKGRLPQFFGDFERQMEDLMEQLFADGNTGRTVQAFTPRTTIAETANAYEIEVDLPGIQPADLQVVSLRQACMN